jgi:hypothetical protein
MHEIRFQPEYLIHTVDEIEALRFRWYQVPVALHHNLKLHAEIVIAVECTMLLGEINAGAIFP